MRRGHERLNYVTDQATSRVVVWVPVHVPELPDGRLARHKLLVDDVPTEAGPSMCTGLQHVRAHTETMLVGCRMKRPESLDAVLSALLQGSSAATALKMHGGGNLATEPPTVRLSARCPRYRRSEKRPPAGTTSSRHGPAAREQRVNGARRRPVNEARAFLV